MVKADQSPATTEILNLFRGLAALWVATAHCMIWSNTPLPAQLEPKIAVDLFMVISGFLMMFTIDRAVPRDGQPGWKTWRAFYIRRFFRVAPVYYVALALMVILWPVVSAGMAQLNSLNPSRWLGSAYTPEAQDFSLANIVLHLTFVFGLIPRASFSTALPDWSLSLEMQFYAVFPVLYMLCRRSAFAFAATMIACAALVFIFLHIYYPAVANHPWLRFREPSFLLLNLHKFAIGMLIYEAGKRRSLLFAGLAALVLAYASRTSGIAAIGLIVPVFLIAGAWCFGVKGVAARFLKSGFVTFLSEASYSLYLLHGFFVMLFWRLLFLGLPRPLGVAIYTVVVLGASYSVAWLSRWTIEEWGNRAGKAISGTRRPTAPPMA